ncbi:hypothetical protein PRIC2_003439 [Phytophthora ramorum]
METPKRARKTEAAGPASSSDTDSDHLIEKATAAPSPSSALGKRSQDDSLASTDAKKQRVRKSQEDKLAILQFLEDGGTHVEAAERFTMSRAALEKLVNEQDKNQMQDGEEQVTESDMATPSSEVKEVLVETEEAVAASAAVLSEVSHPVEMGITTAEAAGLNVAVAASTAQQVPPPRPRKGRRVRKTNLEKMEILAYVDQGGSQGAAAEKFGVSRTAVTKMVKERAAISAQAMVESATSSRKVLQYQHKLSVIEDMLYKWQMQVELDAPALKITGDLLQSKAMEFRNKILADYSSELSDEVVMSLTDFKASNGWLHRYMQRRSMRSLPKQQAVAPERLSCDQRIQKIRELLLAANPGCIWTLDELVLRHRTTSARLDSVVNMDARSLERVSIAMAASASGEKLHLQVVGKDPNPDSLKDVDTLSSYGVQYRDHCRAAHDATTIVDFMQAMNQEATARKQVWFLVLDSCTAHVAAAHTLNPAGSFRYGFSFDSIVLLFLPPGPSSDAHPLHQGVLRSFKLRFRREMLQTLLQEHEQWSAATKSEHRQGQSNEATPSDGSPANEVFDVHAHTHLRNTLSWLHKAWESVPDSLIRHAWSASLYLPAVVPGDGEPSTSIGGEDEIKAYSDLLAELGKVPSLQKTLGLDFADNPGQFMLELLDFDKFDANGMSELAKDNEIVIDSLASQGLLRDTHRTLVLENIKSDDQPLLTVSEANSTASRLLHFMSQDNDNLLTLSERRTGRANLLILQRLLLKARERERERESTTDFTV